MTRTPVEEAAEKFAHEYNKMAFLDENIPFHQDFKNCYMKGYELAQEEIKELKARVEQEHRKFCNIEIQLGEYCKALEQAEHREVNLKKQISEMKEEIP